jgi:3-isopropylmalate/(R)-2-methylmalate dehydratase small subunit
MQKFPQNLSSVAAPLPLINVDTDIIIPKQFLKTVNRNGLGKNLFHEIRYDNSGNEIASFILNIPAYRNAKVLIANANFGCGSSREHAPWALLDFGIRVIIAPSFADIFFNNCFKNSILPIVMPQEDVTKMLESAKDPENQISISLEKQQISFFNQIYNFEINQVNKKKLLEGLDEIAETIKNYENQILDFEKSNRRNFDWLWN